MSLAINLLIGFLSTTYIINSSIGLLLIMMNCKTKYISFMSVANQLLNDYVKSVKNFSHCSEVMTRC